MFALCMLFFTTNYTNFTNSFLNTDYTDYTDIYRFAVFGVPLWGRNFIKLNSILFKIHSIFDTLRSACEAIVARKNS